MTGVGEDDEGESSADGGTSLPPTPKNFIPPSHTSPKLNTSLPLGRVLQTVCRMWEGRGARAGEPNGLTAPGVPSRTLEHYDSSAKVLSWTLHRKRCRAV